MLEPNRKNALGFFFFLYSFAVKGRLTTLQSLEQKLDPSCTSSSTEPSTSEPPLSGFRVEPCLLSQSIPVL